jgi:hypothetical protein
MEDLQSFLTEDVGVTIYDRSWQDQTPLMTKQIHHIGTCPEGTHVRIYFDEQRFFAVPYTAAVTMNETEWIAFDKQAGLHYMIRKECAVHD